MPSVEKVTELQEQFESWNPMQDDYTNSQFNQYSSGPGAYLDPALQPGELAKGQKDKQQTCTTQSSSACTGNEAAKSSPMPYLVFKHIPAGLTKHALYNICARHGRVSHVRDSTKNDYYFVDLASISDMEAVYRALENNSFGFKVLVGKQFSKKSPETAANNNNNTEPNDCVPSVQTPKESIDFESRTYRASGKQPPRPRFSQKPIVTPEQYEAMNSLLKRNDPQRHFLIQDDAHALERAGLQQPISKQDKSQQKKYKYRTGRAYIDMPDKTREFVEEKNQQSIGQYNDVQHAYSNNKHGNAKSNIGQCANCQRVCDVVCARCSTYFCGLDCRREAWPQHRYICGKPKNLLQSTAGAATDMLTTNCNTIDAIPKAKPQATESTTAKSSPTASTSTEPTVKVRTTPRSGNVVRLAAVSKPNVVFLRSKTYDDDLNFFKTIHKIQAMAKDFKPLQKAPACGQIVMTYFEKQYNRAMVLNADNVECIKVVYIDYGNLDSCKLSALYEAPEELVAVPRFAIPVVLKGVPDCYMTEQIRTFMYSYLEGIDLLVKYKADEDFIADKGVHCVELFDESTNQNFNKMISKLCKPVEPTDPNEVYFRQYLTQTLLPAGENIELVVMDNSLLVTGIVSCTTKAYAFEIEKFQIELQRYAEALEPQCYTPRVDELCIAKYGVDGKWYRGRCLEIVGDGHPTIVFFDYGNVAMINIKNIRRYPSQFTYPIYTSECEIKGLPEECSPELVFELEKCIPNGSTLHCDAVHVYEEDNFHVLTMSKLIHKLKSAGLLDEKDHSDADQE